MKKNEKVAAALRLTVEYRTLVAHERQKLNLPSQFLDAPRQDEFKLVDFVAQTHRLAEVEAGMLLTPQQTKKAIQLRDNCSDAYIRGWLERYIERYGWSE